MLYLAKLTEERVFRCKHTQKFYGQLVNLPKKNEKLRRNKDLTREIFEKFENNKIFGVWFAALIQMFGRQMPK